MGAGLSVSEARHQLIKGKAKVTGIGRCLEPSELSSEVTDSPSGWRVSSQEVIHILMGGRRVQDNSSCFSCSLYRVLPPGGHRAMEGNDLRVQGEA